MPRCALIRGNEMSRKIVFGPAAIAAILGVCACQTTQVAPSAHVACPPSLTAPMAAQPSVPSDADVDLKDTPEARQSANLYLSYVSDLAAWGRDGWSRASTAKTFCEARK
jgi:hypothetical protein